ncbi:hypothetical protein KKG22_05335 [Patescibacteria group bacterium]|nr:hypothetical protein [Patescibacteria group bacterium]MBU1721555.1 hypothetical protein [Patescibacteria group bacterium]MBU1901467.1 hypothetical protein [Patescibacteria group bacterium]
MADTELYCGVSPPIDDGSTIVDPPKEDIGTAVTVDVPFVPFEEVILSGRALLPPPMRGVPKGKKLTDRFDLSFRDIRTTVVELIVRATRFIPIADRILKREEENRAAAENLRNERKQQEEAAVIASMARALKSNPIQGKTFFQSLFDLFDLFWKLMK